MAAAEAAARMLNILLFIVLIFINIGKSCSSKAREDESGNAEMQILQCLLWLLADICKDTSVYIKDMSVHEV